MRGEETGNKLTSDDMVNIMKNDLRFKPCESLKAKQIKSSIKDLEKKKKKTKENINLNNNKFKPKINKYENESENEEIELDEDEDISLNDYSVLKDLEDLND